MYDDRYLSDEEIDMIAIEKFNMEWDGESDQTWFDTRREIVKCREYGLLKKAS